MDALIVNLVVAHLVQSFGWSSDEELDMTEIFSGAGLAVMKEPLSCIKYSISSTPVSLYTD